MGLFRFIGRVIFSPLILVGSIFAVTFINMPQMYSDKYPQQGTNIYLATLFFIPFVTIPVILLWAIFRTLKIIFVGYDKEEVKEGIDENYWAKGKIRWRRNYKGGELHGTQSYWDEQGNLTTQEYKDGHTEGDWCFENILMKLEKYKD
jgi:hypothetical protein